MMTLIIILIVLVIITLALCVGYIALILNRWKLERLCSLHVGYVHQKKTPEMPDWLFQIVGWFEFKTRASRFSRNRKEKINQLILDYYRMFQGKRFNRKFPNVRTSSGICGGYTFGDGELDYYGYWENPNYEAARYHEKLFPEDGECWPYKIE